MYKMYIVNLLVCIYCIMYMYVYGLIGEGLVISLYIVYLLVCILYIYQQVNCILMVCYFIVGEVLVIFDFLFYIILGYDFYIYVFDGNMLVGLRIFIVIIEGICWVQFGKLDVNFQFDEN